MDLSSLLKTAPRAHWLALNETRDKILAASESVEEVLRLAQEAGADDPILFWVPERWTAMVAWA